MPFSIIPMHFQYIFIYIIFPDVLIYLLYHCFLYVLVKDSLNSTDILNHPVHLVISHTLQQVFLLVLYSSTFFFSHSFHLCASLAQ